MELYLLLAIGVIALLVGAIFVPMLFRRVVPTNEVHIVQNSKQTVSYGKDTSNGNVYYQWPAWIPFLGVTKITLPMSVFDLDLSDYEAYDQGRLPFRVDVKAFFRVNDSNVAAQRVASFDELRNQLEAIVQGSVRTILAGSDIEEIMQGRSTFGDAFTKEVTEQLKSWGVTTVKNIELMDIRDGKDSLVIKNIMEKKKSLIEMESRTEVAENKKKAEVAEIEARREVDLQKQQVQQQVGLRTVEAKLAVEQAEENKKQLITEQSKATAEKELEVQKIKTLKAAEIEKEAAIVRSNQEKEVEIINANRLKETELIRAEQELTVKTKQADADAKVQERKAEADALATTRRAEADAEATKKRAEADLTVKLNNAKGLEAEGKAKAESEAALLMAPVTAQIAQAKEIGSNKEYQQYLITIEQVKANQEVGIAQAEAIGKANIKVIANTGSTVDAGINSVKELFSAKGGTQIGTMLEGLANTDLGKELLNKAGLGNNESH